MPIFLLDLMPVKQSEKTVSEKNLIVFIINSVQISIVLNWHAFLHLNSSIVS